MSRRGDLQGAENAKCQNRGILFLIVLLNDKHVRHYYSHNNLVVLKKSQGIPPSPQNSSQLLYPDLKGQFRYQRNFLLI